MAVVAMTGCSVGDDGAEREPTTTVSTAVPTTSRETEWVAIYVVEPAETVERTAFIEAAGPQVFEGPASCWEGVPARLEVSADAEVLGVVAATEERLQDATDVLPGEPIVTGGFARVCPSGAWRRAAW